MLRHGGRRSRPLPKQEEEDTPLSADHGKVCETKHLYQTKKDEYGRTSWTTQIPSDINEVAENSETAKYALLIRNEKCYDGRRQFTVNSIVVQSPAIKEVLGGIFKNYTGLTINVRRLEFQSPWHCFVHRWAQIVDARDEFIEVAEKDESDTKAAENRDAMSLLCNVLRDEIRDTVNTRNDLLREGVMTYELLWTLFEPGSIALHGRNGARVTSSAYTPKGLQVNYQIIDWDGQKFGYASKHELICPYTGSTPVRGLPIYPILCREDAADVERKIIRRAAKFERLCGFRYVQYDGPAEIITPFGTSRHTVHGRVVVDTESWNSFNPNYVVSLTQMETTNLNPASTQINGESEQSEDSHVCRLTRDQLLIASSTLRGYSAKDKRWMLFETDNVNSIKWDTNAFSSLVLPPKHKELVRSVAESQAQNSTFFDDIIQGKGQGMILLLNGPPGVGKTLTAESVAEVMKVPLYYMSTVDLGSDAASIETTLNKVFRMVTKWNAVLLLDEADVFLEKRTTHDLERNKLVSVMLRVLEYYTGILFLTSNRAETIDDAFQSRIHLRLTYKALTADSRRQIWRNFLRTMGYRHVFNDDDIDELAAKDLNGRQIKNLLKTAILLAARKGEALGKEHVDFVLEIDPQA